MARFITRWEPMQDMVTLRDVMDRLHEDSFVQPAWRDSSQRTGTDSGEWRLPVDVYATPEEIVITTSVPGVKPEEVEITFQNDVLTIRGELPAMFENVDWVMRERTHGRFSRSLTFNVPVDAHGIEANFENGVLTVVAPKAETAKPKMIKVMAK